jgi:hypothetical protein
VTTNLFIFVRKDKLKENGSSKLEKKEETKGREAR